MLFHKSPEGIFITGIATSRLQTCAIVDLHIKDDYLKLHKLVTSQSWCDVAWFLTKVCFLQYFHFHCCTYFLDLWWYYFSVVSVGVDCHLIVSAIWTLTIFGRNPLRNSWPVLSWLLWRALKVERSQQIATVSWGESVNGVVVTSNSVESFIWNWAQGTGSFLKSKIET